VPEQNFPTPRPATRSDLTESVRVPVDTYILKVASRCNLNCSYCYVYNKGDDSYKEQPYRMSSATVSALLKRVANYCVEQNLGSVTFIFHGGEPLLAGTDFVRRFVVEAATTLGDRIKPSYVLQTNGTLLTSEWLDLFSEVGIVFGISLDGPKATNDRHRVNHAGEGSYDEVRRALDSVIADRRLDNLFGGVLTVIDLTSEPLELYRHLRELGTPRCDFLLPDGTYDNLPPGLALDRSHTPYADWLIQIFDAWFDNQDTALYVRLFDSMIKLLFDPASGTDAWGGARNGLLVIETDGGIEPVDVLKVCGASFTKLGLNVARNEIREVYSIGLVNLYQQGAARVCDTCRACPVLGVCGGGYLPHRYRSHNGFANPSIYCRDLMKLITHVRDRVLSTIPQATRKKLQMQPLPYEEALALLNR
jgi:uncharacterized protein